MFKTQQDIWGYLAKESNNKVINTLGTIAYLLDGFVATKENPRSSLTFASPTTWSPYTGPTWQDKLDGTEENAVWCCVSDITKEPRVAASKEFTLAKVLDHSSFKDYSYISESGVSWVFATPLTEEDKQTLFPS